MDDLMDRARETIENLQEIVDDVKSSAAKADTPQRQLQEVNNAIRNLESSGVDVPDELRKTRIALMTTEAEQAGEPAEVREFIAESLREILETVAPKKAGKRGRSRTNARRRGESDVRTLEKGELPPAGSDPVSVEIRYEELSVTSWTDLLVGVAEWLIENDFKLPSDGIVGRRRQLLSNRASAFNHSKTQLSNGMYINTTYGCEDMVRATRQLVVTCGLSEEDLSIRYYSPPSE